MFPAEAQGARRLFVCPRPLAFLLLVLVLVLENRIQNPEESAIEGPPYARRIAPRRGALQKRIGDRKIISARDMSASCFRGEERFSSQQSEFGCLLHA